MGSPDLNSLGFLRESPDALRYDFLSTEPDDVAPILASMVKPGRVLDVGCGTGSITEFIQKKTGADVQGLEPDPLRQASAVARGLNVRCGYLTDQILKEGGPFDTIIFADVLEHLPSPGEVILLAKRGLAPGGVLVASMPNIAHLFVRLNLLRGEFEYRGSGIMDATHLRWFTKRTVHSFFENLGFKVVQHRYTANTSMPEYRRRPWRWLPYEKELIRMLLRLAPNLFGCQHVVQAVPIGEL